jgi:hypothetical protein
VGGGLFGGWLHLMRAPVHYRRTLRRLLIEQYGGGPHHCTVEIHPDHVFCAQVRSTTTYPWSEATAVHDVGGDVEITFGVQLLNVRRRAFASESARLAFLDLARRLAVAAPAPV